MKFIKTVNSPVDTADFVAELEEAEINYKYGDNGVYVSEEDFDKWVRPEDMIGPME